MRGHRRVVALAPLWVGGCFGVATVPPPSPFGASSIVDGTRGIQGYAGVRSGIPLWIGLDAGVRAQVHDHVAIDFVTTGDLSFVSLTPGIWFNTAKKGETRRHNLAFRLGPTAAVGDYLAQTAFEAFSMGLDTRGQYVMRWAPRGALHVTVHGGVAGFLNVVGPDGESLGPSSSLGASFGVDIPAGPVSFVVQTGGHAVLFEDRDIPGALDAFPGFHASLGVRWGQGAGDMPTVRARRAWRLDQTAEP